MLCETFNRIVESRATVSGACAKVEKSLASNSSGSGPFFSRVGTMDDLQRIRPGRPRFCPFGGADPWFSNSQRNSAHSTRRSKHPSQLFTSAPPGCTVGPFLFSRPSENGKRPRLESGAGVSAPADQAIRNGLGQARRIWSINRGMRRKVPRASSRFHQPAVAFCGLSANLSGQGAGPQGAVSWRGAHAAISFGCSMGKSVMATGTVKWFISFP
jgi:hypothetical protein